MNIGEQLKAELQRRGTNATQFSRETGLNVQNVYKWLKGTNPSDSKEVETIQYWIYGKLDSLQNSIDTKPKKAPDNHTNMDQIKYLEEIITGKEKIIKLLEKQETTESAIKDLREDLNALEEILRGNNVVLHELRDKILGNTENKDLKVGKRTVDGLKKDPLKGKHPD